jgi:DNA-binding CsgD family transcriptional regulator
VQSIIRKKSEMFAEQENKRLIQIEQQDKQIIKLRAEKLEADLTYKGKELASATMLNINHNEFLKKLKSQIQQFTLEGKINRLESKKLQSMIGENISYEEEWKVFQENFDLIHENFFRNLKERYPTLTPGDLKLCALLRLNYSTKEITRLLNISMRGVESARYRLRKKLSLDKSANLVEFLINFR